MIERFKSIYSSNQDLSEPLNPNLPSPHQQPELNYNRQLVQRTNSHATKMR